MTDTTTVPAPPGKFIEGLTADMPLLAALEMSFRRRWEGVLYFLPRAIERAEKDTEHVHKLRVSSRRLTAILDVLAEGFPEAPRKKLFKVVNRIRRSCGKARNLDVQRQFLETMLPQASVEDAAVIEVLCRRAIARRKKVQKKLRKKLPKLQERLERTGEELLAALQSARDRQLPGYASFGQTGTRTLQTELAALWGRAEGDLGCDETLHQLRIACKHLRYAVEVFFPILHESFAEDFYPQLEHVQDLLGEFNDAAQATRAYLKRKKKLKRLRGTPQWGKSGLSAFKWREVRAGLDAVLLAYVQQADQARMEFLDIWPGFAGDSFRVPVEEMLAPLAGPASDERLTEKLPDPMPVDAAAPREGDS